MYHIPWSKMTGTDGADIVLTKINAFNDPVTALRHHLSANAAVPDHAPLFAYETADGGWAPMTKPWFMARCTEIWDKVGMLDKVLGHGFRIGGATELLLMGTPPDIVAIQGWWKSHDFLEYWRHPAYFHFMFSFRFAFFYCTSFHVRFQKEIFVMSV
jgi:hypothetical protein